MISGDSLLYFLLTGLGGRDYLSVISATIHTVSDDIEKLKMNLKKGSNCNNVHAKDKHTECPKEGNGAPALSVVFPSKLSFPGSGCLSAPVYTDQNSY